MCGRPTFELVLQVVDDVLLVLLKRVHEHSLLLRRRLQHRRTMRMRTVWPRARWEHESKIANHRPELHLVVVTRALRVESDTLLKTAFVMCANTTNRAHATPLRASNDCLIFVRNGRHTWKWFVNSPNASHSTCALTAIISTLNASISPLLAVRVLGSVRVWVSIHA